nr:MAG TPA: hypothetical protein [Caudoviricetes sp.]
MTVRVCGSRHWRRFSPPENPRRANMQLTCFYAWDFQAGRKRK